MKPLKIRAWDDILNEMIYSKPEQFDDSLLFRFDKHFETEKPIYMWSTGLLDKNGKEIYAGDILKGGETWQCLYVQTLARFMLRDKDKEEYNMSALAMHDFEVIGSIYSNPELLEVTP